MTKMEFANNRKVEEDTSYGMLKSDEVGFEDTRHIARHFNDTKTTNKTTNTFNTFNSTEDGVSHKMGKRREDYSPYNNKTNSNGVLSVDDYETLGTSSNYKKDSSKEIPEAKKLPLKPNPIKKRPNNADDFDSGVVENDPLVIQSKEYINKNVSSELEEIKE